MHHFMGWTQVPAESTYAPYYCLPGTLARRHTIVFILSTGIALSGCTAEQTYNGMLENQRTQCLKLPTPQQTRCLAEEDMSFEEYRRLRKEALSPTSPAP